MASAVRRPAPRRVSRSGAAVLVSAIALTAVGPFPTNSSATSASNAVSDVINAMVPVTPEPDGAPVSLDTTIFLPLNTPAPAVIVAPGMGADNESDAGIGQALAASGFAALTFSPRGVSKSGGLIHLNAPNYEIADGSKLIDYLAGIPQIKLAAPGDPEVGVVGGSNGGAFGLLLAAYDSRVKTVAADVTWNDLITTILPNAAGDAIGVLKKAWLDLIVAGSRAANQCGRFAPDLCASLRQLARTGAPNAETLRLLKASSPSTVLDRIKVPVLLSAGEHDSLFTLDQTDATARALAENGTPVKVMWRYGGHDDPGDPLGQPAGEFLAWLRAHLLSSGKVTDAFQVAVPPEVSASSAQSAVRDIKVEQVRSGYPGATGPSAPLRTFPVAGREQTINAPANGTPAALTVLPVANQPSQVGAGTSDSLLPGQYARFSSAPMRSAMTIAGAPTVRLSVSVTGADDAVLFAGLHVVTAAGVDTLPANLVVPLRVDGLTPGTPTTVSVRLPSIVQRISTGDRLELTVATTDRAYFLPADARTYTLATAPGGSVLNLPLLPPTAAGGSTRSVPVVLIAAIVGLVALIGVGVAVIIRARRRSRPAAVNAGRFSSTRRG